jgi:hypothetical protein
MTPSLAAGIGLFIYCLTIFLQRYQSDTLSQRMLIPLFNRIAIVYLLSLVLTALAGQEPALNATAFFVGVFPQTGIQWIANLAKVTPDNFSLSPSSGFRGLPEIDITRQSTLAEVGISDVHDLATADLSAVILRVGIQPQVLTNAVDRAILLEEIDRATTANNLPQTTEPLAGLASLSIFKASDLVLYLRYDPTLHGPATPPLAGNPVLQSLLEPERDRDKAKRMQTIKEAGVRAPDFLLERLQSNSNVIYILEKGLAYCDV